ncbi:Profilin-1A [Holothuria leucospilota]|uniref:Profilin n=1 Tax=Holothuria leucospilota TaxID=206669 RepID=A0A9Q1BQQ4_HOLLE|nr:Profilin-1A [Holothuria leucospilota]
MSWQGYIDNNLVGSGFVKQAAILGLDGSQWATSSGFAVSAAEAKAMVAGFTDPSNLRASGIRASGEKYMCLRTDDSSLYGKKGSGGICVVKTIQAVLVGTYDESIQPGQCNSVVEKLGDYLRNSGY